MNFDENKLKLVNHYPRPEALREQLKTQASTLFHCKEADCTHTRGWTRVPFYRSHLMLLHGMTEEQANERIKEQANQSFKCLQNRERDKFEITIPETIPKDCDVWVFLDLETTGFSKKGHKNAGIIEFACKTCVITKEDELIALDLQSTLVNPVDDMSSVQWKEGENVHKISKDLVANAPLQKDVLIQIARLFNFDCKFIAHNCSFEKKVLGQWFEHLLPHEKERFSKIEFFDSKELFRGQGAVGKGGLTLESLVKMKMSEGKMAKTEYNFHRAGGDVMAMYDLLQSLGRWWYDLKRKKGSLQEESKRNELKKRPKRVKKRKDDEDIDRESEEEEEEEEISENAQKKMRK